MLQPGLYHSLFHHYANSLYMLHIFIHWKCQVNPATYSISQHAPQLPNTANSMDAADELDWQQAIMVHRQLMGKQWQDIADLNTKIDLLSQAIAIAPPWITMPQHSSPPMPAPEKFSGDISQCKGFLLRCSLYFTRHKGMSEQYKIPKSAHWKALKWASAVWEPGACSFLPALLGADLSCVWPLTRWWGSRRAALDPHTITSPSVSLYTGNPVHRCGYGCNDMVLKAPFCRGLSPKILMELACLFQPSATLSPFLSHQWDILKTAKHPDPSKCNPEVK